MSVSRRRKRRRAMPLCTKSLDQRKLRRRRRLRAPILPRPGLHDRAELQGRSRQIPQVHGSSHRWLVVCREGSVSPVCLSPHTLPHRSGMCMLTLCKLMKSADEAIVWPVSFAFTACPEQHARLTSKCAPWMAALPVSQPSVLRMAGTPRSQPYTPTRWLRSRRASHPYHGWL